MTNAKNTTYLDAEHEAQKAKHPQIIHITSTAHLHHLIDKYRARQYTIASGLFILGDNV